MEIIYIRVLIIIIATTIAIDFAILAYALPQHSSLILTIEIILLPVIYIIGNYYIEELIKEEYEKEISVINEKSIQLGDKYLKQKYLNNILKSKLKNETKKS